SLLGAGLPRDAPQRRGIKIIVGKDNITKAFVIKFVRFLDDLVGKAQTRLASIGYPHRTEAAVLRASRDVLNCGEHVLGRIQKFPPRLHHPAAWHATAGIVLLKFAG